MKQNDGDMRQQGLRRLLKRLEHARASARGIMASSKKMVNELMDRREIGHRSHFRRGMVADWVEEVEREERYLRKAAKRVKIAKYRPKKNRDHKRGRNSVRQARLKNASREARGVEYLPPAAD